MGTRQEEIKATMNISGEDGSRNTPHESMTKRDDGGMSRE
jgi:hypothetical protein